MNEILQNLESFFENLSYKQIKPRMSNLLTKFLQIFPHSILNFKEKSLRTLNIQPSKSTFRLVTKLKAWKDLEHKTHLALRSPVALEIREEKKELLQ